MLLRAAGLVRAVMIAVFVLIVMPLGDSQDSTFGPTKVFAFAPNTHGALVGRAYRIMRNDGIDVGELDSRVRQQGRPISTRLQAIVDGVEGADIPCHDPTLDDNPILRRVRRQRFNCPPEVLLPHYVATPERHGHNPATHDGWQIDCTFRTGRRTVTFISAAQEAQRYFNRAVQEWTAGNDYDAMFFLGISLHFVQDQSIPHHAAASPESATAHTLPLLTHCSRGRGAHDLYEDWVRDNFNGMPFHATNGGFYGEVENFLHCEPRLVPCAQPNTAYAWSIKRLTRVCFDTMRWTKGQKQDAGIFPTSAVTAIP